MTTASVPTYVVGDTKPDLAGVLTHDEGGGPIPVDGTTLTGAQVKCMPPSKTGPVIHSVTVGSDGTWAMQWHPGDISAPGVWTIEVSVNFNGGGVETFGPSYIVVYPEIS